MKCQHCGKLVETNNFAGRLEADITEHDTKAIIIQPTGFMAQQITDPARLEKINRQMHEATATRDITDSDAPKPGEVAWARDNVWAIYHGEAAPKMFTFWEPLGVDPEKKGIWSL